MPLTLTLAWRNLWRHKRRSILMLAAISFCNIILITMPALQFGTYFDMIESSLNLGTQHIQIQQKEFLDDPRMRRSFPSASALEAEAKALLNSDDIRLSLRAEAFVLASSEERSLGIQIQGVQAAHEREMSKIPSSIKQGHWLSGGLAPEVAVGDRLAQRLRLTVGDSITILGSGRDGSVAANVLDVVGIFSTGITALDRQLALMNLADFQQTFSMPDQAHRLVFEVPTLTDVAATEQRLQPLLPKHSELAMHDWDAMTPSLMQMVYSDVAGGVFIYGILVILLAFSILNTQLMSLLERTKEFGVLNALGLTPRRLGSLIVLEAALLGLGGALIGMAIGGAITLYLSSVGLSLPGQEEMAAQFAMSSRIYPVAAAPIIVAGPFIVLVACVLSAVYPALRLRKLDPVDAMRAV